MPVSVMFAAEIRTELQLDVEAANPETESSKTVQRWQESLTDWKQNIKSEGWRLHVIILTDERRLFCKIEKAKTFFKAKL